VLNSFVVHRNHYCSGTHHLDSFVARTLGTAVGIVAHMPGAFVAEMMIHHIVGSGCMGLIAAEMMIHHIVGSGYTGLIAAEMMIHHIVGSGCMGLIAAAVDKCLHLLRIKVFVTVMGETVRNYFDFVRKEFPYNKSQTAEVFENCYLGSSSAWARRRIPVACSEPDRSVLAVAQECCNKVSLLMIA
jgi:hypothetical protein